MRKSSSPPVSPSSETETTRSASSNIASYLGVRNIVDGGKGLEAALASLRYSGQRCTVHKERNLLAHAPKALHDEVKADYTDMMYAENAEQARKKRKAFLAKWRLRCRGVADSLEEAGERLFTFLRYPPQQWKSLRTTNAIERLQGKTSNFHLTVCERKRDDLVGLIVLAINKPHRFHSTTYSPEIHND